MESEIAKTVAERLRPSRQARRTRARIAADGKPGSTPVHLKGRALWNKRTTENRKKVIDYFEKAIAKDPAYALAYSGLADVHAVLP